MGEKKKKADKIQFATNFTSKFRWKNAFQESCETTLTELNLSC